MAPMQIRVLPFHAADGPRNMAADEVVLRTALGGRATLRFYAWSEATVSLGYFQSARFLTGDPLLGNLPYVRRPSGGSALVHHFEVTYALALPAGKPWQGPEPWLNRMHTVILEALGRLDVEARLYDPTGQPSRWQGSLCFKHLTPGDLVIHSAKIVGSAQRRQKGALVQHGGILLARSRYAPSLPGIKELCGRVLERDELTSAAQEVFAEKTGWELIPAEMSASETNQVEALRASKYSQSVWNDKR